MASQQLLHHHPLSTSITVLDTVSIPTAEQYAFAFEILPSTPPSGTTKYTRKPMLDFQPQRPRHLEVQNHQSHTSQHTTQQQRQLQNQFQFQSQSMKSTIMSSPTTSTTTTTTTTTTSPTTKLSNAITYTKNNFHYLLPAILLNPILFLHALNAMLTAILPDLNIPHSTRTWFQPHLDINHNNAVASIYTVLIIVLQGFACQYCLDVSARQNLRQVADGSKTNGDDDDDDYWQGD